MSTLDHSSPYDAPLNSWGLPYVRFMNPRSHNAHPESDEHRNSGAPAFLWAIVAIMSVIEIVLSLAEAGMFGSPSWRWIMIAYGAFWQPLLSGETASLYSGQRFFMFITYAFLHGGIGHLALNSVILLSLGKLAATNIGARKTLFVLLISAVAGGLAFGVLSSTDIPMIGASGAVFGLLGLWQVWDVSLRQRSGLPLKPALMAIGALVAANVVFFVVLGGGLAWQAHLGGWLAGWFYGRSFAKIEGRAGTIG